MKTVALKFGSLLLLLAGVYALGKYLENAQIQSIEEAFLAAFVDDSGEPVRWISLGKVKVFLGVLLFLLGLYGLLPRIPKRRGARVISFEGPHGPVEIQLDPMEARLNRIIGKMPEIKKAKILVVPGEDGRGVEISAKVILQKQRGSTARQSAMRVSDYISAAATEQLGLEDIVSIKLNIAGILVDSKTAKVDFHAAHDAPSAAATIAQAPGGVAQAPAEVAEAPTEVAEENAHKSTLVEEPASNDFTLEADDDVSDVNTLTLPEAESVSVPEPEPEPEPVPKPVSEPVPKPVSEPEPEPEPVRDAEPVAGLDTSAEETDDSTGFDAITDGEGSEDEASKRKDEPSSDWSF